MSTAVIRLVFGVIIFFASMGVMVAVHAAPISDFTRGNLSGVANVALSWLFVRVWDASKDKPAILTEGGEG